MKNWPRIVLFVSILAIASVADVEAWPPENGICHVACRDGEQYVVHDEWDTTVSQCCAQVSAYICPNDELPLWITWDPYEGWPYFCPPHF